MNPKNKITINELRLSSIQKKYEYYDELAKSYAKFIKEVKKAFGLNDEDIHKKN